MKNKRLAFLTLALLSTVNSQLSTAFAQGTAFTYQGRLNDGGSPATGIYDLRFAIYDSTNVPGTVIAGPLTNAATGVSNGLFTVALDFGANFPGADRFLEIGARTNGGGAFTTLSPRQKITATPYAITAGNLTGTVSATGLAGTYSSAVTLNNAANSFAGNGAGLTALNAGNVSSGTLNDGRLSTNVALRNANQTFTGANTFNHPLNSFTGSFTGNGASLSNLSLSVTGAVSFTTNAGTFGFAIASAPFAGDGPSWVVTTAVAFDATVTKLDFNGDGKLDLVCANTNDNTLRVLTNNGSGRFVPAASAVVGSGPVAVAAADVNGDGRLDLISANAGVNTLTVLTNNGSGAFGSNATLTVSSSPDSIVAADVNGDGKVDLISANRTGGTLTVLSNNGSGGFVVTSQPSVSGRPRAVIAVDVNGDTTLDLITANDSVNTLTILLNSGPPNWTFAINSAPVVSGGPRSVVAADVNGDTFVDLISADTNSNTLTVLTNIGDGTFVLNAHLPVGSVPYAVTAADVNGDGKVDLISANSGNDTLTVLTNNGSGGFGFAFTLAVGSAPYSVAAADVNGDGTVDLISANFSGDTLTVLTNTLTGTSVQSHFTGGRVLVDPSPASLPGFSFIGDENTGIFQPAVNANIVAIATAGVERLRVNSTGVGIGLIAPEAPLHVADGTAGGVTANANSIAVLEKSGDGYLSLLAPAANTTGVLFGSPTDNTDGGILYNVGSLRGLQFRAGGNSTKMSILADGKVGIGRTPTANALEVEGNASKTTATAWLANSDARIKTDVHTVTHALERLAQVRPVEFRYTDEYRAQHPSIEDRPYLNVIAQEFQKVFPEAVKSGGDKLPDGEAILQVDSYPLTIYSAAAIQELNRKLTDELNQKQTEITELKRSVAELKALVNQIANAQPSKPR